MPRSDGDSDFCPPALLQVTWSMVDVAVLEVSVDPAGRLLVVPRVPRRHGFEYVYRAAMEVSWDPEARALVAPAPREWSYGRWFQQIVRAAADECGVRLYLDDRTSWLVSSDLKAAILELASGENAR
jgi:hypothetical protein